MPFTGTDAPNLELDEVANALVGATLANGAVVINAGVRRSYFIVLAVRTDFADERYATWALSPRDGETFWGHYHMTLDEAISDFKERL